MKKIPVFYILYVIFVAVMLVLLLVNSKADLHLWMTSCHTGFLDVFFRYYTEVGGWIPFLIATLALFYRYRVALLIVVAQLFTGLIEQTGKWIWNEPRPKLYFQQFFPDVRLHEIPGVHMHLFHSFPSGHTTAAFSVFLILAMLTRKKILHVLYLLMAVLVGYSRVYLSQHFAVDVLVGSMIGVFCTLPCKYWMDKINASWIDKSLLETIQKK